MEGLEISFSFYKGRMEYNACAYCEYLNIAFYGQYFIVSAFNNSNFLLK